MTDVGRKWSPFVIGSRYYITPDVCDVETPGMIDIRIGAGRAFGSGEHETTQQCLEIMELIQFCSGTMILDYGTGTGILAIAAAKLGAEFVLALDVDMDAVETCQNNLKINNVNNKVTVICSDLTCINPRYQFDLILANIYPAIIIKRSALISALLKRNGYILLSGIDWDYFDDVKRCFSHFNYQIVKVKIGNDYNSILYQKVTDK